MESTSAAPLPSRARQAIRAYERARPWRQRARVRGYPWPVVSRPCPAHHWAGEKESRHARCTTDSGRGAGAAVVPLHVGSSTTLSSGAALRRRNSVSPQLRPPEETIGLLPEASLPCLSRRPHLLYDYVYGRMPGPLYVRQSNRGAGASRWTRMRSDTAFHLCRAQSALVAYTHAALPCTVVPTKSLSDVCGSPRLTHLPARLARRDYGRL